MSLFKSGNPTLSEKIFEKSHSLSGEMNGTMTVKGAINKFGFLLVLLIAGAAFTWQQYYNGQVDSMKPLILAGIFGGLIVAIAVIIKPNWSPYLAPLYAILQGFFVGAASAILNDSFKEKYPGLILHAVAVTFGVAIAMFLLYNFRVIKVTQKMRSIVLVATLGIAIFYFIDVCLFYFFNFDVPLTSWNNTSWTAIGFSILMVILASFNLLLDFDMIENGAERGAPKFMEWYGAFGLLVTIVWLYIEILKLLSRFAKRD